MTIDYAKARETMVEQQVRPWDVLDARVLDALVNVPRDAFVPAAHRALAYADAALPLGHGESMMKPVVEGRVLQALDVQAGEDVLEIGTGSGFLTACLGRLAREVHSIDRHGDFADAARARLDGMGLGGNVRIETADAFSWETDRRFDAMGLVLLLDRCEVVGIDPDGADLVTAGGARQRFRRRPLPPGTVSL